MKNKTIRMELSPDGQRLITEVFEDGATREVMEEGSISARLLLSALYNVLHQHNRVVVDMEKSGPYSDVSVSFHVSDDSKFGTVYHNDRHPEDYAVS